MGKGYISKIVYMCNLSLKDCDINGNDELLSLKITYGDKWRGSRHLYGRFISREKQKQSGAG